jgi:uncharacterized membrane protein
MQPSKPNFFPLAISFIIFLFLIVAALIGLIELGILRYAYEKIGIDSRYVFGLLLLSLLGSYVNIPIAELPPERVVSNQEVAFFGMRYVIPLVKEWPRTVIAINLGGAVIPVLVSVYLVLKNDMIGRVLVAVAVVTVVVYRMARPLRGIGIAVPIFIPPAIAAVTALLLSPDLAPALAYTAGTLGTLIGGDLLNLRKIRGLGAPVVSIGGAGTFDGIFLTGIIAVLLA